MTKTRAEVLAMSRAEFEQSLREMQASQSHDLALKRVEESLEALRAKRATHLLLHADIRELTAELVKDGLSPESAANVAAASIAARATR